MSKETLQRSLTGRHIMLIAIGGAIGTGLFLGAGRSISLAGPSILLVYAIIGCLLFFLMRALGELLLSNTDFNSFADIARAYLGNWAGFFTGWTYWFCWVVTGMAEITAVAKYIGYWWPSIPQWLSALACALLLLMINLLTVKAFGEFEFWFAVIKVTTIVVLIVIGAVMIIMGTKTPSGHVSLTHIWSHGGFFPNGAKGFILAFQMAVFSFVGVELIGVTAGETKDPEKTLPKAINAIPIRILLFYIGTLIVIMSVTPWNKISAVDSPFVTLFAFVGIPAAATIINFVVISAAASSCNSGLFSTSRMLYGLGKQGDASPKFAQLNSKGVPALGLIFSAIILLFGVLLNYFLQADQVFTIVTSLATVLFVFVWAIITVSYILYQRRDQVLAAKQTFKMPFSKVMPWILIVFFIFVLAVLCLDVETRIAIYVAPIWFALLGLFYVLKQRHAHKQ
ncbi:amino acid permease [Brochothrix campestris]|uniref:D-serine D-alanine glycine transporter n=1 Tax=Brochothrix campestris FSL F6-1037 TaxID=1265861 RepID=W7CTD5_9LIST|nr:amino acid permease [Brochothrix campestris]EUJ40172.1 D-serine D-alanine glycine transporter [Brochothrix campestris FSL F6-1037]